MKLEKGVVNNENTGLKSGVKDKTVPAEMHMVGMERSLTVAEQLAINNFINKDIPKR